MRLTLPHGINRAERVEAQAAWPITCGVWCSSCWIASALLLVFLAIRGFFCVDTGIEDHDHSCACRLAAQSTHAMRQPTPSRTIDNLTNTQHVHVGRFLARHNPHRFKFPLIFAACRFACGRARRGCPLRRRPPSWHVQEAAAVLRSNAIRDGLGGMVAVQLESQFEIGDTKRSLGRQCHRASVPH